MFRFEFNCFASTIAIQKLKKKELKRLIQAKCISFHFQIEPFSSLILQITILRRKTLRQYNTLNGLAYSMRKFSTQTSAVHLMIILHYYIFFICIYLSFACSVALYTNREWDPIARNTNENCNLCTNFEIVKSHLHALWLAFGVLLEFSDVFYLSAVIIIQHLARVVGNPFFLASSSSSSSPPPFTFTFGGPDTHLHASIHFKIENYFQLSWNAKCAGLFKWYAYEHTVCVIWWQRCSSRCNMVAFLCRWNGKRWWKRVDEWRGNIPWITESSNTRRISLLAHNEF